MSRNQSIFFYRLALGLCFATTVAGMDPGMNSINGQPPMGDEGNNSMQLHVHRRGLQHWVKMLLAEDIIVAFFVFGMIVAAAFGIAHFCHRRNLRSRVADVEPAAGHHEPVHNANVPALGVNDIELAQMPTGNAHATTSQAETSQAGTSQAGTSQAGTSLTKRMILHSRGPTFSRNAKAQKSPHGPGLAKCSLKSLESQTPEEITSHPCYSFFEPAYKIVITNLNKAGELEKIVKFLGTKHNPQNHITSEDAQAALQSYPRTPAIVKDINDLLVDNAKPGLSECFKQHLSW
ncbi:hypothetical protein FA10DRAFT_260446 [Acaromyces ingoldii]|uniref:Uncharacterized protein n=1 Tax=Acaromyces ingoldii TaxID=215250 RepID=A0A316YN65_9BASI|nr:hypothetical protein FA10DRAFT_260446 [Acaromyces ingoldii]PWN90651.1 hypothetical protein FA10DRAFT_260446 [Acaromyces ingoldii]